MGSGLRNEVEKGLVGNTEDTGAYSIQITNCAMVLRNSQETEKACWETLINLISSVFSLFLVVRTLGDDSQVAKTVLDIVNPHLFFT